MIESNIRIVSFRSLNNSFTETIAVNAGLDFPSGQSENNELRI